VKVPTPVLHSLLLIGTKLILTIPANHANRLFQLNIADDQEAALTTDFQTGEVRLDKQTGKPFYTVEVSARIEGKRDKSITAIKVFEKPDFELEYLTEVVFKGNVRLTHYVTNNNRLGLSIVADGIAPAGAVAAQNAQVAK
jgi:hypothetical protein